MKLIKTADLRDVLDSYNREEISYTKMVDLLNDIANKRLKAINYRCCCKSDSEYLKNKKIKDILNWVKSDLKQETNNKIGKTATPYRADKIRFLNKLLELQNL